MKCVLKWKTTADGIEYLPAERQTLVLISNRFQCKSMKTFMWHALTYERIRLFIYYSRIRAFANNWANNCCCYCRYIKIPTELLWPFDCSAMITWTRFHFHLHAKKVIFIWRLFEEICTEFGPGNKAKWIQFQILITFLLPLFRSLFSWSASVKDFSVVTFYFLCCQWNLNENSQISFRTLFCSSF